jgi:hypothetical protein
MTLLYILEHKIKTNMSLFDWDDNGDVVTEEFLLHNGFTRCRQYTNYDVITYNIYSHNGSYGIIVNLDMQAVAYRTILGAKWSHCQVENTQQIILLLSQLKTCK